MRRDPTLPDLVPVLSAGKHRNPRKGACFMEMASFLAGERWSDHPSCTHPLLASLARLVNDWLKDEDRSPLVLLVRGGRPDRLGPGRRVRPGPRIATRAAAGAASGRHRPWAATLLADELLNEPDGLSVGPRGVRDQVESRWATTFAARTRAPTRWARRYGRRRHRRPRGTTRRQTAPRTVAACMEGLPMTLRRRHEPTAGTFRLLEETMTTSAPGADRPPTAGRVRCARPAVWYDHPGLLTG